MGPEWLHRNVQEERERQATAGSALCQRCGAEKPADLVERLLHHFSFVLQTLVKAVLL